MIAVNKKGYGNVIPDDISSALAKLESQLDSEKAKRDLAKLEFIWNSKKAERWKQISREAGELYFQKKREERWSYLDTRNTLRHTAFMRNMRMMIRGWCEDEFKKG